MEQIRSSDGGSSDLSQDDLLSGNNEFRGLAREHKRHEARLTELAALTHPSDAELLEEATLKKKKLAIKDQMQAMMLDQRKAGATH